MTTDQIREALHSAREQIFPQEKEETADERTWLLAERASLQRMLEQIPLEDVLDRSCLLSRLEAVESKLNALGCVTMHSDALRMRSGFGISDL